MASGECILALGEIMTSWRSSGVGHVSGRQGCCQTSQHQIYVICYTRMHKCTCITFVDTNEHITSRESLLDEEEAGGRSTRLGVDRHSRCTVRLQVRTSEPG